MTLSLQHPNRRCTLNKSPADYGDYEQLATSDCVMRLVLLYQLAVV
jgi:hypothetical protein